MTINPFLIALPTGAGVGAIAVAASGGDGLGFLFGALGGAVLATAGTAVVRTIQRKLGQNVPKSSEEIEYAAQETADRVKQLRGGQ